MSRNNGKPCFMVFPKLFELEVGVKVKCLTNAGHNVIESFNKNYWDDEMDDVSF